MSLIRSYMENGHFMADIDPLQLESAYAETGSKHFNTSSFRNKGVANSLDITYYGFSEHALDK